MDEGQEEQEPLLPLHGHFSDVFSANKSPPEFVVKGILPAGLVFMAGPPKEAYKSTLTMGLAALVAHYEHSALPQEWTPTINAPVMVFSYEADAGELRCILEDGLGVKGQANEGILICDRPS